MVARPRVLVLALLQFSALAFASTPSDCKTGTCASQIDDATAMMQSLAKVSQPLDMLENDPTLLGGSAVGQLLQVGSTQLLASEQQSETASFGSAIPAQLFLTGQWSSVDKAPADMQRNLNRTMSLNPDLTVRWFSDADCYEYIKEHLDDELSEFFAKEKQGNYRGDLCRGAILAKGGGFYSDLDVEWKFPMDQLVGEDTTFMSAITRTAAGDEILNALIAASPRSEIMSSALEEMKQWYRRGKGKRRRDGYMGTMTLFRAVKANCPESPISFDQHIPDIQCGNNKLRLYKEIRMRCTADDTACPLKRRIGFDGLKYAIVKPGSGSDVVAYPRFVGCNYWGCGGGGWTKSEAKLSDS